MEKYKSVWISSAGHDKYLVNTKAGVKYIARPPDALQDAITKAKNLRVGDEPIRLISFPNGKYSDKIVG